MPETSLGFVEPEYENPLDVVVDWVTEFGGESYYANEGHLNFDFEHSGFKYSATATLRKQVVITIAIVLEFDRECDELDMHRRMAVVDLGQEDGGMHYDKASSTIIWRGSLWGNEDGNFAFEDVDIVIEDGVLAFDALRVALADLFGEKPADLRLAQMQVLGQA